MSGNLLVDFQAHSAGQRRNKAEVQRWRPLLCVPRRAKDSEPTTSIKTIGYKPTMRTEHAICGVWKLTEMSSTLQVRLSGDDCFSLCPTSVLADCMLLLSTFSSVQQLRDELMYLQEASSSVGEVVKTMGKTKVLVKVRPWRPPEPFICMHC